VEIETVLDKADVYRFNGLNQKHLTTHKTVSNPSKTPSQRLTSLLREIQKTTSITSFTRLELSSLIWR